MKNEGFIYVIGSKVGFKIGIATDYKSRFSEIKVSSPLDLWLEKTYRVRRFNYVEKKLHGIFSKKHIRGEWFKLNKSDIIIIDGFIRNNGYLIYEVDLKTDIYVPDTKNYRYKSEEANTVNEIVLQTEINNLKSEIKRLENENIKLQYKIFKKY